MARQNEPLLLEQFVLDANDPHGSPLTLQLRGTAGQPHRKFGIARFCDGAHFANRSDPPNRPLALCRRWYGGSLCRLQCVVRCQALVPTCLGHCCVTWLVVRMRMRSSPFRKHCCAVRVYVLVYVQAQKLTHECEYPRLWCTSIFQ